MVYPQNFEQKIGFDRLREQVAAYCSLPSAQNRLVEEGFTTDRREIERRLDLADEMRSILILERDYPDGGYADMEHLLGKIEVEGSFLHPEELLQLSLADGWSLSLTVARGPIPPSMPVVGG